MTHTRVVALLGAVVLHGTPLPGQDANLPARWALQVLGPAVHTHGDLRFDRDGARLLLEDADSVWHPLSQLDTTGTRLSFTAAGRRFAGERDGDTATGTIADVEGGVLQWRARAVLPGFEAWPVRPRVAVRQLVVGSAAVTGGFSDAWLAARPTREVQLQEHAVAAAALAWPDLPPAALGARAADLSLGFLPAGRVAGQQLLGRIAASPAADAAFQRLFAARNGTFRLDLHDVAWEQALRRHALDPGDATTLITGLRDLGFLPPSGGSRPEVLVRAGWHAWVQGSLHPTLMAGRLATIDPEGAAAVRDLLRSYDDARAWWIDAVRWLLVSPWVEGPDGWRSPTDLLTEFWGGDIGRLPTLVPHVFGVPQAVPVLGAARLAPWLLQPRNAIAAEWLARPAGAVEAIRLWRAFDVAEPLEIGFPDGARAIVTAPAALVRTRYGSFLAAEDAIRIEPSIGPIAAVATVVHEWLHILLERRRLEGDAPPGLRDTPLGLRLLEPDPWLGEGFAEWGTDQVLAPIRPMTSLYAVLESGKRLGLAAANPDDTHVLGHELVHALATRVADPRALRDLLARHMHDPAAVASAVGLAGPIGRSMPRPATLSVIPEYVFTPDAGVADNQARRLLLHARPEAFP